MQLIERDLRHVWHPCSQMKDYEIFLPLMVSRARGSYFELNNGTKIIDAISSWWCKSLGHNHPRLKKALMEQLEKFEHVILANTTNETIVRLSEKLSQLVPALDKVFYASDGSSAIEIALKMSLHSRQIQNQAERRYFLALENGYHGETIGALSISDIGLYNDPYRSLLFSCDFIKNIPYVTNAQDPLWNDCQQHWNAIEPFLEKWQDKLTAIIVEPLIQGACGMRLYSRDFLRRLRAWTKRYGIHFIADEIMTGIGRTGKMLACDHAEVEPDFICLSKGLTSGWLPLSVVLTRTSLYNLFYDDYAKQKSFLHSHTFSGNALAASVALEVLDIFVEDNVCAQAKRLGDVMYESMREIAEITRKITNVRGIGAIVAADIVTANDNQRWGFEFFKKAVSLGAFMRPIGNTIYWLPPLNMDLDTLQNLKQITIQALHNL